MKRSYFLSWSIVLFIATSIFFLTAQAKKSPALFRSAATDTTAVYLYEKGKSKYCQRDVGKYYTSLELNPKTTIASVLPANKLFCVTTNDNYMFGPYYLVEGCVIQTHKSQDPEDKNPVQTTITASQQCIPPEFMAINISSHDKHRIELAFSKYNDTSPCAINVNKEEQMANLFLFNNNDTYIGTDPNAKFCVEIIKAGVVTRSFGPFNPTKNCTLKVEEDGTLSGSSACS